MESKRTIEDVKEFLKERIAEYKEYKENDDCDNLERHDLNICIEICNDILNYIEE